MCFHEKRGRSGRIGEDASRSDLHHPNLPEQPLGCSLWANAYPPTTALNRSSTAGAAASWMVGSEPSRYDPYSSRPSPRWLFWLLPIVFTVAPALPSLSVTRAGLLSVKLGLLLWVAFGSRGVTAQAEVQASV